MQLPTKLLIKNDNMNPYENIDWMLNDDKQLHLANVSGRSEQFVCLCLRTDGDNCDRIEPCKECETCPHFSQTNVTTRYYFFRDLDNESNLLDGKTFHASGIVEQVFNEKENANGNKDLSVLFFEPFKGTIINAWRTYSEVELFEVSKDEYDQIASAYKVLYNEL